MKIKSSSLGFIEGWVSIFINTVLFGFKYWAGTITGSVAMVADAWHTISDSLTSAIVIIGFWMTSRPADSNHPFGHGRAESISSIIIATLLGVVGLNFFIESLSRIVSHQQLQFSLFAIIVFGVSAIFKEGLAQFSIWAGKKIGSDALKADGWHHRSDAIASIVIVIGALLGNSILWLDGILGIFVSILILWATYEILKNSVNILLGQQPDKQLINEIKELIQSVSPNISNIHNIKLHSYGELKELSIHINLPDNMTFKEAHQISNDIENKLFAEKRIRATVHFEPVK
jgi:cation diffusion facilitator family transporter